MASRSFRSGRPDSAPVADAQTDPNLRRQKYGPILPMEQERGFFRRWFRR